MTLAAICDRLKSDYFAQRDSIATEEFALLVGQLLTAGTLPALTVNEENDLLCTAYAAGTPGLDLERLRKALGARDLLAAEWRPVPSPLPWTLRAVLTAPTTLSLDSPIVHVFFVQDIDRPVEEVIVIGRGCGRVRERLTEVAVQVRLSVRTRVEDIAALEEVRETATRTGEPEKAAEAERQIRLLKQHHPAQVLDGLIWLNRAAVDPRSGFRLTHGQVVGDVGRPFELLVDELKQLGASSAMVERHTITPAAVAEFRPNWEAAGTGDKVFIDEIDIPDRPVVVAPRPFLVRDTGIPIRFELPRRVFERETPYAAVREVFIQAKAEQALADAEARRDFHEKQRSEAAKLRAPYEEAVQRNNTKRLEEFHKKNVNIDFTVDMELAAIMRLNPPESCSGQEYYQTNLRNLIENHTNWRDRMQLICDNIYEAIDAGRLDHFGIAYLTDRALRGLPPTHGEPEWPGMAKFQERIRPLLRLSLSRALEAEGAPPDALATRRTFFTVAVQPDTGVVVQANYLFVNTTSVIDPRRSIHRVADRIDRMETNVGTPPAEDASKDLAQALNSASPILDAASRGVMIRNALTHHPRPSLACLMSHFIGLRGVSPAPTPDPMYARRTIDQVRSLEAVGAFHGAMTVLVQFVDRATSAPQGAEFGLVENCLPEVPALLVILYLQCTQNTRHRTRKPPKMWEQIRQWAEGKQRGNLPDRVVRALALIENWEEGYLTKCAQAQELLPSKAMETMSLRPHSPASIPTLLEGALTGLRAARKVAAARTLPKEPVDVRRVYRLLGDAIGSVAAGPGGFEVDFELQELSTRLLGAVHVLNQP